MSRFISLLIKFLVFFLPLFFWPLPLKFELAKVGLFFGAGFLLVFWLLTGFSIKNFEARFQKLDKIWFLWVGILFLSTLINQKFPFGFLAGGYRHQSVIFFFVLGLFMMTVEKLKTKDRKTVLKWAAIAIIIEILVVYGQWLALKLNLPILSYNQRPIGTLGEPNGLAGFFILGLPILTTIFQSPLIPTFAIILAIFLTGSKAGILAVMAELLVFGYLWKKKMSFRKVFLSTSLILVLVIGVLGVYLEKGESLYEDRWLIWNLGIKAVQEKPILGYGAEGIIKAYDKQYQQIDRSLFGVVIGRSHNLFLDISLFSGLIGLGVFSFWFWKRSQKVIKKENWILASLMGFFVFSFFQPIGVTHWFYLVLLISLPNS